MTLYIQPLGTVGSDISIEFVELRDLFVSKGFDVLPSKMIVPGFKDAIIIGLMIASLTAVSINSLISVLNYWQNQKKEHYKLTFEIMGHSKGISELTDEVLHDIAQNKSQIIVNVTKLK